MSCHATSSLNSVVCRTACKVRRGLSCLRYSLVGGGPLHLPEPWPARESKSSTIMTNSLECFQPGSLATAVVPTPPMMGRHTSVPLPSANTVPCSPVVLFTIDFSHHHLPWLKQNFKEFRIHKICSYQHLIFCHRLPSMNGWLGLSAGTIVQRGAI